MALQKQSLPINFSGDLDLKTDPYQVAPNNFLAFQNSVRTVGGRLQKRNGFGPLASFQLVTSLATFGGALVGVGSSIQVLSQDTGTVFNRGYFAQAELSVMPAIRTSGSQTSSDCAIAPNGLACVVATDSTLSAIYQIIESGSGNSVVPVTTILDSASAGGCISPRVFVLGAYFVVTFLSSTNSLQYIAIPYATPANPLPASGIIGDNNANHSYDGFVNGSLLYLAYVGEISFTQVRLVSLSSSLTVTVGTIYSGTLTADSTSVTVDSSGVNPVIWVSYVNRNSGAGTVTAVTTAFSSALVNILPQTTLYTATIAAIAGTGTNITTLASGALLTAYVSITYPYATAPSTPYTNRNTDELVTAFCTQSGTVSGGFIFMRGLGLASKAFISSSNGSPYMLGFYRGTFQPTYFLIDANANIAVKLAYSNGNANSIPFLSSVNVVGTAVVFSYLYRDTVLAVNKAINASSVGGIYAQSGVNLATVILGQPGTVTSEVGGGLILTGGFPWIYDGQKPVEQNFHLYPEDISIATATTGGSVGAGTYFYYFTYEWTEGSGNIERSAPSVPVSIVTTGSTSVNTLHVPYLRETAKLPPNQVRIVGYRYSVAQPIPYQFTSITSPILNTTSADAVTISDTLADSSILGNSILYTEGGVIENIAGPATEITTLFDSRLWVVDSEDPNLLWFSKQVIETTPVEFSDLLTVYVAPTTSSQASTGPTSALSAMDDKLIIFKSNAIYYINGTGPDNTGANSQYSQPIFITAAVGCNNPQSIVLTPMGLMFQSNQGIWLLGRDLSTKYIGAPVEGFNSYEVTSALSIPETTQVRFVLTSGTELVYDYYFEKWDTCLPIPAISSVIYEGLHTYLNNSAVAYQETPGAYLDNSATISLGFETPWYNLVGLQGYERAYYFTLLGTYISPHTLSIQIYYDYVMENPEQATITPDNAVTGSTLEQWRIFFKKQRCQSFKLVVTEIAGTGAGLTISGLNLIYGAKKVYRPFPAKYSVGAS